MEAMIDGSGSDGVFAAAVNANDGMVVVALIGAALENFEINKFH
jgi:hypothetical protein